VPTNQRLFRRKGIYLGWWIHGLGFSRISAKRLANSAQSGRLGPSQQLKVVRSNHVLAISRSHEGIRYARLTALSWILVYDRQLGQNWATEPYAG